MNGQPGTIYLLHFDPRYRHAGHYLGWTGNGVGDRIGQHLAGRGSPLVAAAVGAGSRVELVATWAGDRNDERRIKRTGAVGRYCPACHEDPRRPPGLTEEE